MSETTKQLIDMINYVKDSFVIDGKVEYIVDPPMIPANFKCTDKKRGVFYVGWQKEKALKGEKQ